MLSVLCSVEETAKQAHVKIGYVRLLDSVVVTINTGVEDRAWSQKIEQSDVG